MTGKSLSQFFAGSVLREKEWESRKKIGGKAGLRNAWGACRALERRAGTAGDRDHPSLIS